jgi:hypothetical protein
LFQLAFRIVVVDVDLDRPAGFWQGFAAPWIMRAEPTQDQFAIAGVEVNGDRVIASDDVHDRRDAMSLQASDECGLILQALGGIGSLAHGEPCGISQGVPLHAGNVAHSALLRQVAVGQITGKKSMGSFSVSRIVPRMCWWLGHGSGAIHRTVEDHDPCNG